MREAQTISLFTQEKVHFGRSKWCLLNGDWLACVTCICMPSCSSHTLCNYCFRWISSVCHLTGGLYIKTKQTRELWHSNWSSVIALNILIHIWHSIMVSVFLQYYGNITCFMYYMQIKGMLTRHRTFTQLLLCVILKEEQLNFSFCLFSHCTLYSAAALLFEIN